MAATVGASQFIESLYRPHELQTATPLRRLGGYVLDSLIAAMSFIALIIGPSGSRALLVARARSP